MRGSLVVDVDPVDSTGAVDVAVMSARVFPSTTKSASVGTTFTLLRTSVSKSALRFVIAVFNAAIVPVAVGVILTSAFTEPAEKVTEMCAAVYPAPNFERYASVMAFTRASVTVALLMTLL